MKAGPLLRLIRPTASRRGMGRFWRPAALFLLAGISLACMGTAMPAGAQDRSSGLQLQEQKIKAGLVYNFLKYTSWPSRGRDSGTLRLCLYGGDSFDGYLHPLRGRTAQQSVIIVSEISRMEEIKGCQLLFINQRQENNLSSLLMALRGHSVLTISDMSDFTRRGGMVEFAMQDQHMVVYVNKSAISAAGLRIDDRMMKFVRAAPGRTGRE